MGRMLQTVREKEMNRKLTAILQGQHQPVLSISVAVNKWFHSREKKELYKFIEGVFEAYPAVDNNEYQIHFTHKVLHEDYKEVKVPETPGGRYVVVSDNHTKPEWKKLTEPTLVNATLAKQHHLHQTSYDVGIDAKHSFTTLQRNSGFNVMVTKAKNREQVAECNAMPEILAWFK